MTNADLCVEKFDDRIRMARQLVERGSDWLRRDLSGFGEAYLKGQGNIALRCVGGGSRDYGPTVVQFHQPRVRVPELRLARERTLVTTLGNVDTSLGMGL